MITRTTIYIALHFALEQCEKHDTQMCPVTFDQPLYIQAAEIVAAEQDLNKIIRRLGGFHLLVSFVGRIGQIMTGSGLPELWDRMYAKGSVVHMLTGHAFSRALRAHILTVATLICVLMETPGCMNSIDKDHSGNFFQALLNKERNTTDIADEECIRQLILIISQFLTQAVIQSRTGKLWMQYIQQLVLMQHFNHAERTGN